jgi:sugar-specific transcriptional regulator TrmB
MEEKLREILKELGLSAYKIEAYINLLKLSKGTIQEIAKNSNIPSCKLYETLKWLHQRGYISLILQKPITYIANSPESVIKDEVLKKENKLNSIKQDLKNISLELPKSQEEILQIFNTEEALKKKIMECLSNSNESVSYILHKWSLDSGLLKLSASKIKKGVHIRALGPIDKKNLEKAKHSVEAGIKIKNYSPKSMRFSIFDKKTVILRLKKQEKENVYILIKSEVLGEIFQNFFNILWKNSK